MEFVMIVCSATLQEDLNLLMKKNHITAFTQIPVVYGAGHGGGTRLDTEVWPGMNTMLILALDSARYEIVRDWVVSYRQKGMREGVKLFSLALKEII